MMKRKACLNGRIKCISFLLAVVILLFSLPAGVWLAEDGGIIADGVYLLDNAYCYDNYPSYGKFYLRTDGVATNTFTPTITASTDTYGALDSDIYRYWYFEHLGNNEYVIRSMANRSQVLTVIEPYINSFDLSLRKCESSESSPNNARWIVSRGSYGYVLVNKAKSKSLRVNPSHSLSYATNSSTSYSYAYIDAEIGVTAEMSFDCWRLTSCKDFQSIGINDSSRYYIMNGYTGRYLSLASQSTSNGINVSTKAFSASNIMRWRPIAQDDLSYQIENVYSSKVLNLTSNLDVNVYSDSNTNNQMFTIERIESGDYKGLYYIRFGSYYLADYGSNHEVRLESTPSARAAWSFKSVVKRDASLYNFYYTYIGDDKNKTDNVQSTSEGGSTTEIFNTTESRTEFVNWVDGAGYNSVVHQNSTALSAYNSLLSSDIFVYRGHAGPGGLSFQTTNNVVTGQIVANNSLLFGDKNCYFINYMADNDLSLLRCVLLLGCSTGVSIDGYNLVDAIYNKGAHFVLGTTKTMETGTNRRFFTRFLSALVKDGDSNSIAAALQDAADANDYEYYDENNNLVSALNGFPYYAVGDKSQYLN